MKNMLPFTVIFAICYFAIPPGIQGIEDIELKDVLRIVMRFVILYFLISTCPNQKNAGIQASESTESIVSLNVGGTVFQTSPSTMLKYPGSKFEKMFNEDQRNKNLTFFLDEDPEYFQIVLNFLRKGKLFTFDEENLFDGVFDLAKNFKLAELVKVLENDWKEKVVVLESRERSSKSSESIVSLNVGGTIFQTSPSTMLKYPGSKLEKMLNEGQMIKNLTFFLD